MNPCENCGAQYWYECECCPYKERIGEKEK